MDVYRFVFYFNHRELISSMHGPLDRLCLVMKISCCSGPTLFSEFHMSGGANCFKMLFCF